MKEWEERLSRIEKLHEEAAKWRAESAKARAEADVRLEKSFAETDRLRKESDVQLKAMFAETDRLRKESDVWLRELFAETDRKIAERSAETDKRIDKVCAQMGGIDSNIGHHAEQFFQDAFAETLTFGGEKYDKILKNFIGCSGTVKDTEFDIVLVNGKSVAVIEVKNRVHPKFVKLLAEERLAIFRSLFPEYQKHRVYLGIAGFSFPQQVLEDAREYGIGIIKQVGQSIEVEAGNLKAY